MNWIEKRCVHLWTYRGSTNDVKFWYMYFPKLSIWVLCVFSRLYCQRSFNTFFVWWTRILKESARSLLRWRPLRYVYSLFYNKSVKSSAWFGSMTFPMNFSLRHFPLTLSPVLLFLNLKHSFSSIELCLSSIQLSFSRGITYTEPTSINTFNVFHRSRV